MELNKVEVTGKIGGKQCYIISMRLVQGFNCHHKFEITVDYEDLDSKWMNAPESIFMLLGQEVTIEMKHKDGKGLNLFIGIITQASCIGHHGGQNHIRISGCSPTIKLDGSKTMDSFMDYMLSDIASEAVATSGNGGSVIPQPKYPCNIEYICQYNETCFEFLNRLSYLYGEWFFYDGLDCYFGKKDGKSEEVMFESEIMTIDLNANLLPTAMKRYQYLEHDDRETDIKAPDPSTQKYLYIAQGRSSSIYTSKAILPSTATIQNDGELDFVTKAEKNRATHEILTINGTSQTSKIKIGGKINVKLPKNLGVLQTVDTFLVTSVVHEYDLKGQYRNTFTGISATVENVPAPIPPLPIAGAQLAWVTANVDPKERGRIKVQFQWQKETGKTTNWIRQQTEDAGYSDVFAKNRGHTFLPEIDDQVIIGFLYNDPNRPYMAGAIFPETKSEGGKIDNNIKSIKTRSGHIIEFNDSEADKSITITDISTSHKLH